MNRELEALIQAYDAAKQASPSEIKTLRAAYEAKLETVLRRCSNLSRSTLEAMIRLVHGRWLRAQQKPAALPPKA